MVSILKLLNFPVNSNCYIISTGEPKNCILVDPSQEEGHSLRNYLLERELIPEFIILTHEHFDHIISVEYLRKEFNCPVVSTEKCSESIRDSKKKSFPFL